MNLSLKSTVFAVGFGCGLSMLAASSAIAAVCDLTGGVGAGGDAECTFNGAIYNNPDNALIVGSGLVDPFLTVQKNGTESGFTTDAASNVLPLDVKRAEGNGQFTRTFTIGDLFAVDGYYRFFLDINEPLGGSQSLIDLLTLKIYNTGSSSEVLLDKDDVTNLTDLDSQGGWSLLYDLGNNQVNLDYGVVGSGSGKGFDMEVLIPTALFVGNATDTIVFASAFNRTGDGFEEWWVQTRGTPPDVCPPGTTGTPPDCTQFPPVEIPEPGTLALFGLGMFGLAAVRRRKC